MRRHFDCVGLFTAIAPHFLHRYHGLDKFTNALNDSKASFSQLRRLNHDDSMCLLEIFGTFVAFGGAL